MTASGVALCEATGARSSSGPHRRPAALFRSPHRSLRRKIPAFLRLRIVLRVHSFEGKFYCVPEDGAQSTERVFSPLAELLALKTQSGDSTRRWRCG
jgi:hypothetical protein